MLLPRQGHATDVGCVRDSVGKLGIWHLGWRFPVSNVHASRTKPVPEDGHRYVLARTPMRYTYPGLRSNINSAYAQM